MLGSNPGLLRLWHWQPDALTTRQDLIPLGYIDLIHTWLDLIHTRSRTLLGLERRERGGRSERIEWFIEGQRSGVACFGSSPPPSPLHPSSFSFSAFLRVTGRAYWRERGERGWARSSILRPQEILALCKSFNTLCSRQKSLFSG